LEKWLESHTNWKPNVMGQVRSWLQDGLKDRAITRDVPWGVPVPEDVARDAGVDARGKVIYVWFDAPIGYISVSKEWAQKAGDPDLWKLYWQDEGTSLIHFIGKDNIVFHCLMFPAMLMEYGEFVLPENVPANEFLNLEGKKLSTSRGWAVWLHEYLEEFPPDLLRYALASTLPETKDADFSGKENFVFHCLVCPAMLMEYGEFVLPENVPANEFLNLEGKKLSTSRGWAVWLHEYLEEFPPDLLRYALASTLPETKDADFSWK